jgi:hypothetical protein
MLAGEGFSQGGWTFLIREWRYAVSVRHGEELSEGAGSW